MHQLVLTSKGKTKWGQNSKMYNIQLFIFKKQVAELLTLVIFPIFSLFPLVFPRNQIKSKLTITYYYQTSILNSSSPCFPVWSINLIATFLPSFRTPRYTSPNPPCPTTFDLLKPPAAEWSCLKLKTWSPFSVTTCDFEKPSLLS